MTRNIIFFCAHDDDISLTMGTVLRYIDEGKNIIEVVFTKGEKSHPHLKEEVIMEIREKEMARVAKMAGIKKIIYLGLGELKLKEQIKKHSIKKRIKEMIQKYNPEKIFTLASSETHPDHRAVNETVLAVVDSLNKEKKKKYPVYTFNIWTTPKLTNNPLFYVDISKYFWKKIKIMKQHKSQWLMMYYQQLLPVIFRARYYGYKNNCKYAEKFEKVR